MKDEIKEIISIYNAILENKDVLIKEATDVYDDVDFKDNVVGNSTPSKDTINLALLQDVQTAAKNAGLKVDITTAVSGHRPSQRHDAGNAVDISKINGKSVSLSNRSDADKLVDALIKMGYTKNQEGSSNPKSVLTFGFEGHNNHVHVSNTTTTQSSSTDDILSVDDKSKGPTNDAWANMIGNVLSSTLNLKESSNFNDYMYIEYCGIKTPKVRNGNSVSKGETLGTTDSDVDVYIYNSSKNKDYVSAHISKDFIGKNVTERSGRYIISGSNSQKIKSPKDGIISSDIYNSACPNQIVIKYNRELKLNNPKQTETPKKTNVKTLKGEKESSIVKFLFDKKYREELGNIVTGKEKSDNDEVKSTKIEPTKEKNWLNKYFDKSSKSKKVQENVNRIKGLL